MLRPRAKKGSSRRISAETRFDVETRQTAETSLPMKVSLEVAPIPDGILAQVDDGQYQKEKKSWMTAEFIENSGSSPTGAATRRSRNSSYSIIR